MTSAGRLVILCGLPGTGKTTLARRLEVVHGLVRMCPDEWMECLAFSLWDTDARARIESLQWKMTLQLLGVGVGVVIEWGTWARSERSTLLQEGRKLGVEVDLHYLDAPDALILRRIEARGRENPPIVGSDLHEWRELIEPPSEEEGRAFDRFVPHWSSC